VAEGSRPTRCRAVSPSPSPSGSRSWPLRSSGVPTVPLVDPYDADNTYVNRQGWRSCRTCKRLSDRRRRARTAKNQAHEAALGAAGVEEGVGEGVAQHASDVDFEVEVVDPGLDVLPAQSGRGRGQGRRLQEPLQLAGRLQVDLDSLRRPVGRPQRRLPRADVDVGALAYTCARDLIAYRTSRAGLGGLTQQKCRSEHAWRDDREAEGDRLLSGYTTICGVLLTQSGWSRPFGSIEKLSSYRRASQWITGPPSVVTSGPEPEADDERDHGLEDATAPGFSSKLPRRELALEAGVVV
jgi:hypothetical protein